MALYLPAQFREDRPDVLSRAMRDIQFATLATPDPGPEGLGVQVTHLPLAVSEGEAGLVLEGHVARPNGHWKAAGHPDRRSVAIFQGPQAYVSPSHYETKRQTGKAVPTWAYLVVHAHGRLEAVDDPDWLARHVGALTEANETGRAAPWAVSDAPPGFIDGMLRAIVGLRLVVTRIEGKWKMNQHRPPADREGTIEGLAAEVQGRDVSAVMRALEEERAR